MFFIFRLSPTPVATALPAADPAAQSDTPRAAESPTA